MKQQLQIRDETDADIAEVYALNRAVFEQAGEANLVDRLRGLAEPKISLVAVIDGEVVGHIFFSPMSLNDHSDLNLMGLAPLAVAPQQQNRGIGSALIEAGLQQCMQLGCGAVSVLGHSGYYPKFGFKPASKYGISSDYDVPDEVFMAQELIADYLKDRTGTIHYHPAFAEL